MKKIISLIICICLCIALPSNALAKTVSMEYEANDLNTPLSSVTTSAAVGQTLDIKAKSAILLEPYTGRILYESNADEALPPASITKIMSLLLVMEAIDAGNLTLESEISASEHACSMGGSQIWLEPNETMTVNELLKAAVIASANDATVALGEAVSGSEEGFVARMNERAKELGMNNTTFINCTGLDAEGHLTTAHDVALMSAALIKHELIKKYSTVWMDTLRGGESELVNTNKLVRFYQGTTGLKTGTTSGAGYCLSATAKRNSMELVAVIMGGQTSNDRFNGAKKLLDYGFANYSFKQIPAELTEGTVIPVKGGVEKQVAVEAGKPLELLLEKSASGKVTQEITLTEELLAPVKKGDKVGSVKILIDGEEAGVIDITAASDINKISFIYVLGRLLSSLFTL